jgi:glycosyltransferase involved in cell wall biosynthesis
MTNNISKPLVSLLVAVRNEENYIEGCLQSIINQDYPQGSLEVIIADGLSTDNTVSIINKLIDGRKNFKLIQNSGKIQSKGWNLAIDVSQGEVLSIVSGHIILPPDYVSVLVETLLRSGVDMVGGSVQIISSTQIGETISLAMTTSFGMGNAGFRLATEEIETDTVFMGFCWRSVYEKIGKYDEELVRNQDDEFSYRLRKAGGKIVCNPSVKSTYYNRASINGLWKQFFNYGLWKVRVLQKHPKQMSIRQFVPPLFVLTSLSSLIISFFIPIFWFLFSLIIGLYLIVNIAVSILHSFKKGWKHLIRLPFVYSILHISYGLGFLVGLVKFINRWHDKVGKVPQVKSFHT